MIKGCLIGICGLITLNTTTAYAEDMEMDFIKNEVEISFQQYKDGSIESGIYALESLARLLNQAESSSVRAELGPNILAFTYIRIGLLHEKLGNSLTAEPFFAAVQQNLSKEFSAEKVTVNELKSMVKQLDEMSI